jgi:hypothetical protein
MVVRLDLNKANTFKSSPIMIYEDTKQSICTQRKDLMPKLIKNQKQTSKKGEVEEVIVTDGFKDNFSDVTHNLE